MTFVRSLSTGLTVAAALASGCASVSSDTNADGSPADVGGNQTTDASDAANGNDGDGTPASDAGTDAAPDGTGRDAGPDAAVDAALDGPPDTEPLGSVVVNELAPAGSPVDWVELYNRGTNPVDLEGWGLSDEFDAAEGRALLPAGSVIDAGGYLLLELTDEWPGFSLGSDEAFSLFDADGTRVDATDWDEDAAPERATWGRFPNGTGAFMTLALPTPGAANQNASPPTCGDGELDEGEQCDDANTNDGDGCTARCMIETPAPTCGDGRIDDGEQCDDANTDDGDGCSMACTTEMARVAINEVVAATLDGGPDAVELYNSGPVSAVIGGWVFTDEDPTHVYEFPSGTTILPGATHLVVRDDTGGGFAFGLGADDSVTLYDAAGLLVDSTDWADGDAPAGQAWGRWPDGVGPFSSLSPATPGATNAAP